MKKLIAITLMWIAAVPAMADKNSMLKDLDSLGSNKAIAERAKAIDGRNRVRIVQNRTVDRRLRLEVAMSYDQVAGGDTYLNSNNLGVMADFHITPRWSIGARYYDTRNSLTDEGKRQFEMAESNSMARKPEVDLPYSSTLGVISFYPLYGKLNFFDIGVTQFDVYMMAGYGQMKLQSGSSPTWTAGAGVGIWWSQHITSRLEARYQSYEDHLQLNGVTREQNITAISAAIGFML